jgi:indole-3-glycerol phosphate synthase
MSKLAEICAAKRSDVAGRKRGATVADLEARIAARGDAPRGFAARVTEKARDGVAVIAEIKRASPSKGLIRADFDPATIARAYDNAGAACLSVLTDRDHFGGDDAFLAEARAASALPALRKDFMVDAWQIAESRALGADAVLLILAVLDDAAAADMAAAAHGYGMDVLVEVHDEAELDRAIGIPDALIGINNRNLANFATDLSVSERLARLAPPGRLLVSESGIATRADIDRLAAHGIRAFLVGESLMRQDDIEAALGALIGCPA